VLFTRVANTTGFRTFFCANQNTTTQQFYAGLTSNSLYFAVGCGTARTVTGATVSIGQHYIAAYSSRAPDDHKIIVRSLSSTGYQSNSITLSCGTSGLAPVDVGLNMRQSSLFMAGVYKHADMLWDRGLDDTELAELMRDPRQVWTTRPERKLFVIPAAGTNATPGAGTGTGTSAGVGVTIAAAIGATSATSAVGTSIVALAVGAGAAAGTGTVTGAAAQLSVAVSGTEATGAAVAASVDLKPSLGVSTGTGTAQALAGALSVSVGADVGTGAATELLGTTPAGVAPVLGGAALAAHAAALVVPNPLRRVIMLS
jgi:hypothetical protein